MKEKLVNLSKRKIDIIRFLANQSEYITASKISEKINVSSKTIYRELNELKELNIIESKIGYGVKIIDSQTVKDIVKNGNVSEPARYIEVMNYMLRIAPLPVSSEELADKYFVSKTSIQNDLRKIENELKLYGLLMRKSRKGINVEGNEFDIRRALANSLISYDNFDASIHGVINTRLDEATRNILYQQFSEELVDYIELLMRKTESDLGYEIVDPYYINIVTHLLIMVIRIMQGRSLNESSLNVENVDIHKLRVAANIAEKIEERYRLNIPDSDIRYIYEHLESIGYSDEIIELNADRIFVDNITKEFACDLLKEINKYFQYDLLLNDKVFRYYLLHVHSMLARLKYHIDIKCPILDEIEEKYQSLFEVTKKSSVLVLNKYYSEYVITDDEAAYLTIYFQNMAEKRSKKKYRIIVVCSSSVGTSHMLMTQIKRKYPDWEIVDQLPASKLEARIKNYDNIDLILSTVKLQNYSLNIPHAFVSVMFSDKDAEMVNKILEERG